MQSLRFLSTTLLLTVLVTACQKESGPTQSQQKVTPGRIYANLLKKVPAHSKNVRPKSAELLALLETGQIDYVFTYKNVATQHGLAFLEFPDEINLSETEMEPIYAQAGIKLTDGTEIKGTAINFAFTIPKNANHPELALDFAKFVLGREGQDIIGKSMPLVVPAHANDEGKTPAELQPFLQEKTEKPLWGKLSQTEKSKFHIFIAGSLTKTFSDLEKVFESKYPTVDVIVEPHGSRTAAKQITELKRPCDFIALADYEVIDQLLIPTYTEWYTVFAKNEMVVIYNDKSKHTDELTAENWFEIFGRPDVSFGRSDPDQDPAGYRTLLLWKLADLYYRFKPEDRTVKLQKYVAAKSKPVMTVYLNDKPVKEVSREEMKTILKDEYIAPGHPLHEGKTLKKLFSELKLDLKPSAKITVEGNGTAQFTYGEAVKNEMGLVPTRRGTPKLAARDGEMASRNKWISHVRAVKITN